MWASIRVGFVEEFIGSAEATDKDFVDFIAGFF
jgi:hypothetical protein